MSVLKMEAVGCSEASVTIYRTTRHHTKEDSIFQRYHPEYLKAHMLKQFHIVKETVEV